MLDFIQYGKQVDLECLIRIQDWALTAYFGWCLVFSECEASLKHISDFMWITDEGLFSHTLFFLLWNAAYFCYLAQFRLRFSSFYLFKALCPCYLIGGNILGHVRNVWVSCQIFGFTYGIKVLIHSVIIMVRRIREHRFIYTINDTSVLCGTVSKAELTLEGE